MVFAPNLAAGDNPVMGYKENKTAALHAMLKPSVKTMLRECCAALRSSEADAVAEAIKRLRESPDIADGWERYQRDAALASAAETKE